MNIYGVLSEELTYHGSYEPPEPPCDFRAGR